MYSKAAYIKFLFYNNIMIKKICILLFVLFFGIETFAFDIVYPKKNNVTINASSTFFIGSSSEPLKINGQDVPVHESGGFAYVVDLKQGENTFFIESDSDMQRYVITRPVIKNGTFKPAELKIFESLKSFYVINDNSPLRTTPVDAGINRISHLQRGILINADAEKGGFYRIPVSKDKYYWIAKTDVKSKETVDTVPAQILGFEFAQTPEYYIFTYHLTKPVPFEILEEKPLTLKFYNVVSDREEIKTDNNIYTKEFPINYDLIGYSGKYSDNDFVWKIRKEPKPNLRHPLKGITVVVDAGHGGSEFGAMGCFKDKEKDINLDIAQHLVNYLKHYGAKVILTRNDDSYLSLKSRVDITNNNDAQVFISIHANALPDCSDPNKIHGAETYYYYNQSKNLAQTILNKMVLQLGLNDNKVHQASFAVVRNTSALSVLIETAYLINPEDSAKLTQPEFREKCAKSIASGINEYFLNLYAQNP